MSAPASTLCGADKRQYGRPSPTAPPRMPIEFAAGCSPVTSAATLVFFVLMSVSYFQRSQESVRSRCHVFEGGQQCGDDSTHQRAGERRALGQAKHGVGELHDHGFRREFAVGPVFLFSTRVGSCQRRVISFLHTARWLGPEKQACRQLLPCDQ